MIRVSQENVTRFRINARQRLRFIRFIRLILETSFIDSGLTFKHSVVIR